MIYGPKFGLLRKGTAEEITCDDPEWSRWLDIVINARQTWLSMFPTLLINSIWFSTTKDELICNLRSLMWGIGVKGYPSQWWRGRLPRFFKEQDLQRILSLKVLIMYGWVKEGKRLPKV